MPHFKDSQNTVYWLDEGDDPSTWLPHCTPITDEEADALREIKKAEILAAIRQQEQNAS